MKKPPPVALLCAGNLTDSAITRFRGLGVRLGPVKSSSLRLASRFANILRAGYPVAGYDTFRECPLLLVAVPDALVSSAVRDVLRADLDWTRVSVILCSASLESEELDPLAELGARTASICEAPASDGMLFVAEGDAEAIKRVRPLVQGPSRSGTTRVLSLAPGHKAMYLAALACTGPLIASILNCAGECLKLAGVTAADADAMLQMQTEKTTRAFLKGGRKRSQEPDGLDRQIAALESHDAELAEFFQGSAKLSRWVSKQV